MVHNLNCIYRHRQSWREASGAKQRQAAPGLHPPHPLPVLPPVRVDDRKGSVYTHKGMYINPTKITKTNVYKSANGPGASQEAPSVAQRRQEHTSYIPSGWYPAKRIIGRVALTHTQYISCTIHILLPVEHRCLTVLLMLLLLLLLLFFFFYTPQYLGDTSNTNKQI